MKLLLSICLFGLVYGRPEIQPNINDFPHDYDFLVSSCLFENWELSLGTEENMNNVFACVGCFDQIEDIMTEEGLPKALNCAQQFLPLEFEACAEQLSNVKAGDEESGEAVSECFEEWVYGAAAEYCNSISDSPQPIDKLTDGSMCMMEGFKNTTMFIGYVHSLDTKDNRAGRRIRKLQKKAKEGNPVKRYAMKKLLPLAACQSANQDDQTRIEDCNQCFSKVNKENHKTEGLKCTNDYLVPYFQDCVEMMDPSSQNNPGQKKDIKKCFGRGIVKHIVKACNPGDSVDANPDTLMATMECGHEFVVNWVDENARPEFAKQIIQFLSFDDDDSEEESEEDE